MKRKLGLALIVLVLGGCGRWEMESPNRGRSIVVSDTTAQPPPPASTTEQPVESKK